MLILHNYFRSSAAYRVRIALHYKQLNYQYQPVHLTADGGKQFTAEYKKINPQSLIPTLIDNDAVITQSLAIMEYLDEAYPQIPILPSDTKARAKVRSYADMIACDIHPINNLRVLKYLKSEFNVSDDQKQNWYENWINLGFAALEKRLEQDKDKGLFCYGDKPTIADFCLVPQIYNAKRFNCSLDDYPILNAINENCVKLAAFIQAAPENQLDTE